MHDDIGTAAGTVWRLLEKRGTLTMSKLKQESKLPEPLALMALGWLARENKIALTKVRNSVQISLR